MRATAKLSSGILTKYLHSCFYYENDAKEQTSTVEIFPDNFIKVFFCYGQPEIIWENEDSLKSLSNIFLTGLLESPCRIRFHGRIQLVGIRFHPWVSSNLWPQHDFAHNAVPLSGIFNELYELLSPAIDRSDSKMSFEILDHFISREITVPESSFHINSSIHRIFTSCEIPETVEEITKEALVSLRQIERIFKKDIGVSPKSFANKFRFYRLLRRMWKNPELNLTNLGFEFGYHNQSHFINDFKSFAGQTPGEFVRWIKQLKATVDD